MEFIGNTLLGWMAAMPPLGLLIIAMLFLTGLASLGAVIGVAMEELNHARRSKGGGG